MKFTVYGISDWPESYGEKFVIFENVEFDSAESALAAAMKEYDNDIECIVQEHK